MHILAIDGINGAGKTPTIEAVIETLEQSDIHADTYAPFHQVRETLGIPDIYPLWDTAPHTAINGLVQTMDNIERDASKRGLDVLIYDRHWPTIYTQAYKVPDISDVWGDRIVPSILLQSPINHALRLSRRNYTAEWLQAQQLEQYIQRYEAIHATYPERFLGKFSVESSEQDLRPIAQEIAKIILEFP